MNKIYLQRQFMAFYWMQTTPKLAICYAYNVTLPQYLQTTIVNAILLSTVIKVLSYIYKYIFRVNKMLKQLSTKQSCIFYVLSQQYMPNSGAECIQQIQKEIQAIELNMLSEDLTDEERNVRSILKYRRRLRPGKIRL